MTTSVCLYFPRNPDSLFQFLQSVVSYYQWRQKTGQAPDPIELLLWVDNDDHTTSKEFYNLRRFIRMGLNIVVEIAPALGSDTEVFDHLSSFSSGDEVICNTGRETHLAKVLNAYNVFDAEEGIKKEVK